MTSTVHETDNCFAAMLSSLRPFAGLSEVAKAWILSLYVSGSHGLSFCQETRLEPG